MHVIKYLALLLSLYFLGTTPSAIAQINASATITGSADSLNFKATITPDARFIGNGSKIWIAYVHGGTVYFNGGPAGFEIYTGGNAPAILGVTQTTEVIDFRNWVVRPILGAEVYVGYGTDFMDMLSNQRFKKIATLTENISIPATGINALMGNVTLQYKFTGSSTIYTDTITFTPTNLDFTGNLAKSGVSGIPGRVIACSYQNDAIVFEGYRYMCAITSSINLAYTDVFWFNITNGVINGRYNFCVESFISSSCLTRIMLGADGLVSGRVTATQIRQQARESNAQAWSDVQNPAEQQPPAGIEHQPSTEQLQIAEKIQQSLQR